MRVLLFDLWNGGHNHVYFERFCRSLAAHEVLVAAPPAVQRRLRDSPARMISVGSLMRGAPAYGQPYVEHQHELAAEVRLIRELCRRFEPDRFVHLFADHLLPHLEEELVEIPSTYLVIFPLHHYASRYGARLLPAEQARAQGLEQAVMRCRQWPSTRAIMTLDPAAAEVWQSKPGAPAVWLPEPPIASTVPHDAAGIEVDIAFYGVLAERKGLSRLKQAVCLAQRPLRVVLAGWVEQDGYRTVMEREIQTMRAAGAVVELRERHYQEEDALQLLGSAGCTVIPYLRHFGMSRLLLESCTVGTPVVVHSFGLLADLVQRYKVGCSVDCDDPHAFLEAIEETTGPRRPRFSRACRALASELGGDRFDAVVQACIA